MKDTPQSVSNLTNFSNGISGIFGILLFGEFTYSVAQLKHALPAPL